MKLCKFFPLVLILSLSFLPACLQQTPVLPVSYFPVRHEPGPSLLLLNYGRLVLDDGLLRLKESSSDRSHLLIWPHDYSYRVAGAVLKSSTPRV